MPENGEGMYKVVVVEDEKRVRRALSWERTGPRSTVS